MKVFHNLPLLVFVEIVLAQKIDEVGNEFVEEEADRFTDTLPGDPRVDYPTYVQIPRTEFSCRGKVNWQYYADIETGCQVFHICESEYSKISFLCATGTIFNQRHLVCDWWYNVDCVASEDLYVLTNGLDNDPEPPLHEEDRRGSDLSPASSGGNSDPSRENKKTGKKPDRAKNSM